MQVFKLYFKILNKQKFAFFLYIGIFVLVMLLLVKNNTESTDTFKEEKVSIAVINEDRTSPMLSHFMEYLNQAFVIREVANEKEAISDALYYEKIQYCLTIPEGFFEQFLNGKSATMEKRSNPIPANNLSADSLIENYLNIARTYMEYTNSTDITKLLEYMDQTLSAEVTLSTYQAQESLEAKSNAYYRAYFNVFSYVLLSCFITGVGLILISFNNIDIRRRNLVSTLSPRWMNFQLILGNGVFCIAYVLLFCILSIFMNPYKYANAHTILFFINALILSFPALALSYLIGMIVKNRNAITAISTALSLGFAFIGGAFVPQYLLGEGVQKISALTPVYWYIKANDIIADLVEIRLNDVIRIIQLMGIQLGFAAMLFTIVMVISKKMPK